MNTPKVFESEYRFCLILWEHEPVKTTELVTLCQEQLGWKPTTTYTVIKRLSERGILENNNKIVTSLVSKDQVQAAEIYEMVEKTFEGALPAFIADFENNGVNYRVKAENISHLDFYKIVLSVITG